MQTKHLFVSLLVCVLVGLLLPVPSVAGPGTDEKKHDERLVKAIEHLQKAVRQNGPEAIKLPWDPDKYKLDSTKEPPDFTSYYARTARIGDEPKIRTDGDSITSSLFVGTKKVGERFKVENWRVSWQKKDDAYVADARQVVQTFDELFVPFNEKDMTESKRFPREVFEFENMQFDHDCLHFSIPAGRLVLVEVDGKLWAAYMAGKGQLSYKPPTQLASDVLNSDREVQQLKYHLKDHLETDDLDACDFSNMILWGHPDWMKSFLAKLELKPTDDVKLQDEAHEAFFARLLPAMTWRGAAFGGARRPLCRLPKSSEFFFLEFDTPEHDLLSYTFNPSAVREVCFASRHKRQLSANELKWPETYCEYDELGQRNEKTCHQLQHESKDEVKTTSWSADVIFEKGMLDTVKKGKFEILFEYETLKPNASFAIFDFSALEPTALTDAGGNDILFFDMGSELLIPVDPVDCPAGRMSMLYAEGIEFRERGVPDWAKRYFGFKLCHTAVCLDGWLPDTGYLDCTDFGLTVTVPERFVVAGVGEIVKEVVSDGYRTKSWVGGHCTRFPGFVAGDMRAFDFDIGSIRFWVFAENGAAARKFVLPEIESSLGFYGKLFGAYPYSKISICPVNWGHGRGFATLLTLTGFSSTTELGNLVAVGDWQAGLYCHEVSHQWWGNIVGWFSPADQWLSEGFAEMSALMYLQSARDNDSVRKRLKDWGYIAKRLDEKGPICLGYPRLRRHYFELTYHKGAYVMHSLRMMVGDEDMVRILRTFVEQFKWKQATTSDFQEVCEFVLGRERLIEIGGEPSLRWFFDEWIYSTGYPKYEFSWSDRKAKSGAWEVVCKVKQVGDKLFKMPIPIWVWTKDGQRLVLRQLVCEKEHEFVLTVPAKPKKAELDPFNNVLCDVKEVKAD